MASEPVRIGNYLDAADTRSTLDAVRALGALVERRGDEVADPRLRAAQRAAARRPDRRRQRRHADAAAARLAGLPAGGRAFTLDGDESIRRRPVDRIAEPLAQMGAEIEATRRPLPAVHRPRRRAARASTTSCPWPAPRSSRACCSPAWSPTRRPWSSRSPAATTPSGCSPRAGAPVGPPGDRRRRLRIDGRQRRRARARGDSRARRPLVRRVPDRRRACSCPARGWCSSGVGVNWTRTGFLRILERMGAIVLGELERAGRVRPATSRCADLDVSARADRGDDGRGRRGAAGDRRAAAGRAARLLRRGRDRRPRRRRAARQGVRPDRRPWSTGCAGWARTSRRTEDGFVVRGTGGLRGGAHRRARRPPPGAARGRRRAGLARRGSRSSGWRPPPSPTRASPTTSRRWRAILMVVAIDGPAGAGKSTRGARGRRASSASPTSTPARCTAAVALAALRARAARRPRWRRRCGSSSGTGCCSTGATSPRRSARRRSPRRRRVAAAEPAVREAMVAAAAAAARRRRLGGGGARHRHRRRSRRRGQGVPHRRAREARARRRAAELGRRSGHGAGRAGDPRRARHARASTRRCRRPPERVSARHDRS